MGVCVQVARAWLLLHAPGSFNSFVSRQIWCNGSLAHRLRGRCNELLNTSAMLQVPRQAVSLRFDTSQYKVTGNHLNTL